MVISQGDVCWPSRDDPVGSSAGFRRPVAVVQGDASHIIAVDRSLLTERVGRLAAGDLQLVLSGIDLVLGRD